MSGRDGMKINLYPFQKQALDNLNDAVYQAVSDYVRNRTPQVIAYTAPTGAGKTIVMSALMETIFFGDDQYEGRRDAIILWLSGDKDLNEQSLRKLESKSDRISPSDLVILDNSFKDSVLEDGKVYYLNTQKIGKGTNLTQHSDGRDYTIWEILENTIEEKSERLFLIIDEAHRGADYSNFKDTTTIMQKFLKPTDDGLSRPMPIVIGMSATIARFNKLVNEDSDIGSTIRKVVTTPTQVRESGLLKDRIIVKYPDVLDNDIAVMQAATDEWVDKTIHWQQFCREQHYERFNPILMIQVQNTADGRISGTNLDDCLRTVEGRSGLKFEIGEVVHTFGDKNTLTINGLEVPYEQPANIQDNKRIKVVFFKDKLSTGWDCPRAETMVSFRAANDATYIAQLVGRMIRTPRGSRVTVDESLNDVCLFLPRFNKDTVKEVLDSLENQEGAAIPADIEASSTKDDEPGTITIRPVFPPTPAYGQTPDVSKGSGDKPKEEAGTSTSDALKGFRTGDRQTKKGSNGGATETGAESTQKNEEGSTVKPEVNGPTYDEPAKPMTEMELYSSRIDRESAAKAINKKHLDNYRIRKASKSEKYWKSLFALIRPIVDAGFDDDLIDKIHNEILDIIDEHIASFKQDGSYDRRVEEVRKFKMNVEVFDVYGDHRDTRSSSDFTTTDADIDKRFKHADNILGKEGLHNLYVNRHAENNANSEVLNRLKIDIILFANDKDCMDHLGRYAKKRFEELDDRYRALISDKGGQPEIDYNRAVRSSSDLPKSVFKLGTNVKNFNKGGPADKGEYYYDHLFVGEKTGRVRIDLNSWEARTIEEERQRPDYVCWLRNASRAEWALGIPYVQENGEMGIAFPDFIVVRRDEKGTYMIDILEPHRQNERDNLYKCKGFAKYAGDNPGVNRMQLIRQIPGREKLVRLELTKRNVREEVRRATTNDQLDGLFERLGE